MMRNNGGTMTNRQSQGGNSLSNPTFGATSMGKGMIGSAVDERVSNILAQGGRDSLARPPSNVVRSLRMPGGGGPPPPMPALHQSSPVDAQERGGPTAQEIVDYARYIGMDPIGDVNLLWIAEEALCAALPEGWTEHTDASGNVFYYNSLSGVSSWEHPLDEYYRSLFMKLKKILIDNRAAVKVNSSAVLLQCAVRSMYARRYFRRLLGKKRLDDAAADIQAVYRGHLVRLKIREESIKQWEELEKFSSTRIQATYRAHLVRRSIAKRREEWRREWRRRSATKLQAVWRGHVGRRMAKEEEMYQALELDEFAVTKLQAVYRGHLGRNIYRGRKKQRAIDRIIMAACKLQAVYRGHLSRLEANAERELQMSEIEFEAAMRIQSVMRGHWGRELRRFRRMNRLACKIQSVYRGHISRLDMLVVRRQHSANKLQAVYRGHISRRFAVHHRQVVAMMRLLEWEETCANKLQSVYRGHVGRRQGFLLIRQTRSALRLQATYRGHMERARLRQSLAEEYAAIQIQRVFQGHRGRRRYQLLTMDVGSSMAALRVQKVFRGHVARQEMVRRAEEQEAAVRLQRVVRGHAARMEVRGMPRGEEEMVKVRYATASSRALQFSAMTVQRVWRGHRERGRVQVYLQELLDAMPQEEEQEASLEEEAALTIQRVTRGHGGRNAARAMMKELLEGAVAREEEEEEEMREDFDNLRSQSRASVSESVSSQASKLSNISKASKVSITSQHSSTSIRSTRAHDLRAQKVAKDLEMRQRSESFSRKTSSVGRTSSVRSAASREDDKESRSSSSSSEIEEAVAAAVDHLKEQILRAFEDVEERPLQPDSNSSSGVDRQEEDVQTLDAVMELLEEIIQHVSDAAGDSDSSMALVQAPSTPRTYSDHLQRSPSPGTPDESEPSTPPSIDQTNTSDGSLAYFAPEPSLDTERTENDATTEELLPPIPEVEHASPGNDEDSPLMEKEDEEAEEEEDPGTPQEEEELQATPEGTVLQEEEENSAATAAEEEARRAEEEARRAEEEARRAEEEAKARRLEEEEAARLQAAKEEEEAQELMRQIAQLSEELHDMYEQDLMSFFDIYAALSEPVG